MNQAADAFGQRGLVRGYICCFDVFGQPGTWQDATCLVGVERLIMETYDDPAWVHELLGILLRRKEVFVESLAGARYDILELGGGGASSTVISPRLFDQFVAPYDSQLIALAHCAGQCIAYHTCGGMMPILENIAAMGPNAMETFTPPGMGGDVDLAEARRRIPQNICMIGGFDQWHFFKNCSAEQTRAQVRRCFEAAGRDGEYHPLSVRQLLRGRAGTGPGPSPTRQNNAPIPPLSGPLTIMPLKSIDRLMHDCRAGGYAIGYFESWNLESLQGVLDAAEQTRSPIIIGFNGEFLSRDGRLAAERFGALRGDGQGGGRIGTSALRSDLQRMSERFVGYGRGDVRVQPGDARRSARRVRRVCVPGETNRRALPRASGGRGRGNWRTALSASGRVEGTGQLTDPAPAEWFVRETAVDLWP